MQQGKKEDLRTRPKRQKMASYLPALIVLGVASALLIYLMTMQGIGWQPPTISQGPSGFPVVESGTTANSGEVVLYASPNTKAYIAKIGGNYEVLLAPWRQYFESRRSSLKEISDTQALAALSRGTLILPSALALDEAERAAVQAFREKGGGVLATWASGSRTGQGEWAGWGFLAALGSKVVGEIPAEPTIGHLVLNGESPVSHTHPAGFRIWMGRPAERYLRLQPIQPDAQVGGRFMNWARIPVSERMAEGAIVFSETSANVGRAVTLGFAESAWDASGSLIHTLLDDVFAWLARKPSLVRANWPSALRSAQLVEMDTEEGFPNALRFAALMNAVNYRGTFYLLSSVAKKHPDVVQALGRDFELGFHGDIHVGFKDQSVAEQQTRIETMFGELASFYPDISRGTGFRAPTEGYDQTTENLLIKNGLRYHVADPSRSEARLPMLLRRDGVLAEDSFVVLPRTQRDDLNFAQEGLTGAPLEEAMEQDLVLGVDMAALGLFSIHSQNYGIDNPLTLAMPAFLEKLKKRQDVWLASGGQIADWWRDRERFKLSLRQFGTRIEFDISVIGSKPFKGGALIVMLPARNATPVIEGTKAKVPKIRPKIKPIDAFRSALIFDELMPGNYNYQLTFSQK